MGVELLVSVPRVADKVQYGPSHSGIPRSPSFCNFGFLRRPSGTRAAGWGSFFVRPLTKKTHIKIAACAFFRHVSMIADWNCNAKWRSEEGVVRSHVRALAGDAKCEKTEVPNFVQKSEFS